MKWIMAVAAICACSGCVRENDAAIVAAIEHDRWTPFFMCLSIEGADPSPALLARLQSNNKSIVPASQCKQTNRGYRVESRFQADRMTIESVDWSWRNTARVKLRIAPGTMFGSSGWSCTVEKRNGVWVVTKQVNDWVS